MKELMLRLCREEAGQSLTEYALPFILVGSVVLATMKTLGIAGQRVRNHAQG